VKSRKLNLFFGGKTLLSLVLLVGTVVFSGCYEKESIDVVEKTEPQPAAYYIAGVVTDYNSGGILQEARVTVGGTSVITGTNGEFSVKLNIADGQSPNPEGYTVSIHKDGYDDVTRQIYVSAVGQGLTSITTANVSLRVTGTSTVPSAGGANPASSGEITQVLSALTDVIEIISDEDLTTGIPDNVKNAIGQVTVGQPDIQVGDGVVNVNTAMSFEKGVTAQDIEKMTYVYNLVSGFEVTGDIEEVNPTTVKSAGDKINDATLIAIFEASVAAELNMSKGFVTTVATVDYPIPAGKKVVGYKIKDQIVIERYTYLINGKYISGLVAFYEATVVEPEYEDLPADTHDSHDGHGHDPNAGGGSGE
jgi:hypothetical protein